MHFDANGIFKRHSPDKKPLIAIVDDDQDNLLLASCIIESIGMDCVMIDDSEKCLSLVPELLPDMILLDIVMPKINGLEIAYLLKQNLHCVHIPIVAVTGLTKAEDKDKIIAAGFDDYLRKPYLIEELEEKVYTQLKCLLV